MAVAAPARRSAAPATAPPPSRTAPPKRKSAPGKGAPRKVGPGNGAAAPARTPARRKPATAPRKPGTKPRKPTRRSGGAAAPARKPVRRAKPGSRGAAQPRLALAVGRSAAAVRHLPDSGVVVRMTRGRAWIAVLGVLLAGIVALNVVTLSFAASSGKVDEQNTALEGENTSLQSRAGTVFSGPRVRHEAVAAGLAMPVTEEPKVITTGPHVVEKAAQRLAEMEAG